MDVGALARATEGVTTEMARTAFHAAAMEDGQAAGRAVESGAGPVTPTKPARTATGSHLVVAAAWAAETHEGGVDVTAPKDAAKGEGAETGAGAVPAKVRAAPT